MQKEKMAYAWHEGELHLNLCWGGDQWPILVHFGSPCLNLLPLPLFLSPHPSCPNGSFEATLLSFLFLSKHYLQLFFLFQWKQTTQNKPRNQKLLAKGPLNFLPFFFSSSFIISFSFLMFAIFQKGPMMKQRPFVFFFFFFYWISSVPPSKPRDKRTLMCSICVLCFFESFGVWNNVFNNKED